jgi:hypothetical protein
MEKIVVFFVILSLLVWGAILLNTAEFVEFAEGNWNFAILIWMSISVLNVAGIMFAMGFSGRLSPRVHEEEPASVSKVVQDYKDKTGKDISHCPDYDTYLDDMELQDDRTNEINWTYS